MITTVMEDIEAQYLVVVLPGMSTVVFLDIRRYFAAEHAAEGKGVWDVTKAFEAFTQLVYSRNKAHKVSEHSIDL